jgi:ATP-binding protein involved in chromosome partitioning
VRRAVGAVVDPMLRCPLGEFDLVGDLEGSPSGVVTMTVRRLLSDETDWLPLRSSIEAAAMSVPGVQQARIERSPLGDAERADLAKRLRAKNRRPGGLGTTTRVYAVGSGKGGVGKSSLTANLAVALAESGQRVGLLDADVWGYSAPQLFGVREAPIAVKGVMLPIPAHGVQVMSIGFFVREEEPVVWRGPMLQKALEQLLDDVYWGTLDVLLIDLPPGTGDVPLTILELLPDAALLVVTTPQTAAEQVAARVGRMALDSRMPIAGVIENMSGGPFGAGGGARLASTLGTSLLGQVPMDQQLCEAGDCGVPLVLSRPDTPAAIEIRRLAHALPVLRPSLVGKALPLFVS